MSSSSVSASGVTIKNMTPCGITNDTVIGDDTPLMTFPFPSSFQTSVVVTVLIDDGKPIYGFVIEGRMYVVVQQKNEEGLNLCQIKCNKNESELILV